MKTTLQPGLTLTSRIEIDAGRTISFLGEDSRVYATPFVLYDVEVASQDLIKAHLDDTETSVGSHVDISHLAPTPLGMWVDIQVTVTAVKGRKIDLAFESRDALDLIARGTHTRYVVDKYQTAEQIKSKKQKATG
jgi:predicted thioesterase